MAANLKSEPWRERLHVPSYPLKVAASLTGARAGSISYWFKERETNGAVVPGKSRYLNLSWLELVEASFVATMRHYGVSLQRIRRAHHYLSHAYRVRYPFAQLDLKTDGAHILREAEAAENAHDYLVVADERGQMAWGMILSDRYEQFDYEEGLALIWHPRGRDRPITLDPRVAFGVPAVKGIPTSLLRARFEAGEDIRYLSDDYGIGVGLVMQALVFEGVGARQ